MALRLHKHCLRKIVGFLAIARDAQAPRHHLRVVPSEKLLQPDACTTIRRSEVIRYQFLIRQPFQNASIGR
jgi:hypothetical protein